MSEGERNGMTAQSSTPTPESSAESLDFTNARILIVDDNPQNAELLEAYLETLGAQTLVAHDGLEAIAIVGRDKPDLILLDIMMPRMSGFEVCRKIKDDPAMRDTPIIMVTALNELGDVERGVESGADDFLSKPFEKQEFLARVRLHLSATMSRRGGGGDLDRGGPGASIGASAPPGAPGAGGGVSPGRAGDGSPAGPMNTYAPTPEELDEETSIEG